MAKRKDSELTTEDAPDSIAPWQMLDDDEIATQSIRVRELLPDQVFVPFARRMDKPWLACFNRGSDGKGKQIAVIDKSDGATTETYPGFTAWFDAATSK